MHSQAERPLRERLPESPDLYPERFLPPYGQIEFAIMSEAAYRATPFLDHRIVRAGEQKLMLPFAEIPAVNELLKPQPSHYVFHNAFTCSTLFTRYLEALQGVLVLREPNSLYEIATMRRFEGTPMLRPLQGVSWPDAARLVQLLLSRRYHGDRPTIIKPTDGCNNLMQDLAAFNDGNRAIFIYSSLERFLVSVMRHRPRHEWVKVRANELMLDCQKEGDMPQIAVAGMTVARTAALVWVLHTNRFLKSASGQYGTRFRSLSSDALLEDPPGVVSAVARFFQVGLSDDMVERCVRDAKVDVNAKAEGEIYNEELRDQDFRAARQTHGPDIEDALQWVRTQFPARNDWDRMPRPLDVTQ